METSVKMKVAVLLALLSLALAGCRAASKPAATAALPVPLLPSGAASALVIAQSTHVPYTYGEQGGTLVSVVTLDGHVSTLTLSQAYPSPGGLVASPDMSWIAYNGGGGFAGTVRIVDVSTGIASTEVTPPGTFHAVPVGPRGERVAPKILAFGWDTSGRLIALTGMNHVSGGHYAQTSRFTGLAQWRGAPGDIASRPVTSDDPDVTIDRFLAADDAHAYFSGREQFLPESPTYDELWRLDLATGHLTRTATLTVAAHEPPLVGEKDVALLMPPYGGMTPLGSTLLDFGLPVMRTTMHTTSSRTTGREYFRTLQGIDVRGLSDLHTTRSVTVTSTASAGNHVFPNEWGQPLVKLAANTPGLPPAGLPLTGDWGLPLFDAGYAHYLRSRAVTGGAELNAYDVTTGAATRIVTHADPLEAPLGYVDTAGTFAYTGSDHGKLAVFLYEPGKGSRLLARLPSIPADYFPAFQPTLLGVQYAR